MSSESELASRLERITVSGSVDDRVLDDLAESLRGQLGLQSMAHSDLREIAMKIARWKLNDKESAGGDDGSVGSLGAFGGPSSTSSLGRGNSSSVFGSNNNLPAGGHHRRGRSPAPRASPPSPSRRMFFANMFSKVGVLDEKKDDASVRSGRESPRLDPSANQPMHPKRAPSPSPPQTQPQQFFRPVVAPQPVPMPRGSASARASSPMPRPHVSAPGAGPGPGPHPSSGGSRAHSPAPPPVKQPDLRSHSPMPSSSRSHIPCSPRPTTTAPSSRPASPFCSRPGLQEDDADSIFSQSPSRRGNASNNNNSNNPPPSSQRRHLRSNSCNAQQMRRGAGDDDDESVQKPQPRRGHRKSSSDGIFAAFGDAPAEHHHHHQPQPQPPPDVATEPLHPASLNLPDFGSAPPSLSVSTSSVSSASFTQPPLQRRPQPQGQQQPAVQPKSPAVGSLLTPPPRPLGFGSFDEGDDEVPVKTGVGKVRRKGGTPDLSAQPWGAPPPIIRPPHGQPFASAAAAGATTIQSSASFDGAHPSFRPIRHAASFDVPFRPTRPQPQESLRPQYQPTSFPLNAAPTVNPPVQFSVGALKPPGARRPRVFPKPASEPAPVAVPTTARSPDDEYAPSPMDVDTPFNLGTPPVRSGARSVARAANRSQIRAATFDALSHHGSVATPMAAGQARVPTPPSSSSTEELRRAEEARRQEMIVELRNEASVLYSSADYRSSIHKYTEAMSLVMSTQAAADGKNDTLAVLLSNRAACFLMLGAYRAAISDCQRALPYVSEGLSSEEALSSDCGPMLKVKLLTRLGRSLLKHGDAEGSLSAFDNASEEAQRVQAVIGILARNYSDHIRNAVSNMISEASIGQTDVARLQELLPKIAAFAKQQRHVRVERLSSGEALGYVNMALKVANGSQFLLETKMSLLCDMKRWREAAGFCERVAASNVHLDGVFTADPLAQLHPFPDAQVPARFLIATYFDEAREESGSELDLKLSASAVAEAVVRLPHALLPRYVRALRLEERYPAADAAIRILEEVAERGHRRDLHWLPVEKRKVSQTKSEREVGDEMYRVGDYDTAARQYASCLLIDSDGECNPNNETAGGRLHAVLHCNRAACFMANKHYHNAIDECTAALKIHSRYMKAMLRRGRCYGRLHRYQDAISELERYIELVEEARNFPKAPPVFVPPCLFDGPKEVTDADLQSVKTELESVRKSKRRSEANAKEEANMQRERYSAYHERFASHYSRAEPSATSNARQRQESWYNRENESRRWDPFAGRRPYATGSASHQRSKSFDSSPRGHQKKTPLGSPTLDPSSDHYTVLGLRRNASDDDIKKTYKKLALKYHPDKNRAEDASEKFLRIQLAYETLSDPDKKRDYDLLHSYQRYQYY